MAGATFILSEPQAEINNVVFAIVPDSLSLIHGFGETEVKSISAGAGKTITTIAEKADTKVGCMKFKLPSSIESLEVLPAWKATNGLNVVRVSGELLRSDGSRDTYVAVLTHAAITNDPEATLSSDGSMELEWKGSPIVAN